jgi:hypothetical protein
MMVRSMSRSFPTIGLLVLLLLGSSFSSAQSTVGEVFAADTAISGTVLYAGSGTTVLSGSQVAAGARPAVLKLTRGGEIRICPNTSVVVSSSPNGRALLFSLNEGDVEFHFDAKSDGDALQTPDYRVQFAGPGRFDIAMCTDKRGGLALQGKYNSRAALIVSEMMGDGVYQVDTGKSVEFSNGNVRDATKTDPPCGCPEPLMPVVPNVVLTEQTPALPPATPAPVPVPVSPQAEAPQRVETHVQVDAPFVFQGDELKPEALYTLAKLETVSTLDLQMKLQPTITPPAEKPAPSKAPKSDDRGEKKPKGFFKKIGSFFGKIFRG